MSLKKKFHLFFLGGGGGGGGGGEGESEFLGMGGDENLIINFL